MGSVGDQFRKGQICCGRQILRGLEIGSVIGETLRLGVALENRDSITRSVMIGYPGKRPERDAERLARPFSAGNPGAFVASPVGTAELTVGSRPDQSSHTGLVIIGSLNPGTEVPGYIRGVPMGHMTARLLGRQRVSRSRRQLGRRPGGPPITQLCPTAWMAGNITSNQIHAVRVGRIKG